MNCSLNMPLPGIRGRFFRWPQVLAKDLLGCISVNMHYIHCVHQIVHTWGKAIFLQFFTVKFTSGSGNV